MNDTKRNGATRPLLADEFFGSSWTGHSQVTDRLGRKRRSFTHKYEGCWSEDESGFLFEEHLAYEGGGELRRSWHIMMDGEGAMLGLEAAQGGRMMIQQHLDVFTFRYDQLPQANAKNVATLGSRLWREPDGGVSADGWTSWLGLVPLLHTRATLRSATHAGNVAIKLDGLAQSRQGELHRRGC